MVCWLALALALWAAADEAAQLVQLVVAIVAAIGRHVSYERKALTQSDPTTQWLERGSTRPVRESEVD